MSLLRLICAIISDLSSKLNNIQTVKYTNKEIVYKIYSIRLLSSKKKDNFLKSVIPYKVLKLV